MTGLEIALFAAAVVLSAAAEAWFWWRDHGGRQR